jgi:hypothetical protein
MQTVGIIVLLFIGFLVFRFLTRAKSMANTANTIMSTSQKINMAIQMARQKAGALVLPGPLTPEKEFYIGYLAAIAEEQARVDSQPITMFRPLVAQEAANIRGSPESESSMALLEACTASDAGIEGARRGKLDGHKLADRTSSQPYFVELDAWLVAKTAPG